MPVAPKDVLDDSGMSLGTGGHMRPTVVDAFHAPESFPNADPAAPNHLYYKVAHHVDGRPVTVADATYPNGDIILPRNAIIAPVDHVPPIGNVAAPAREDWLNHKYSKYIDQVEQKEWDCTNSQAPHCTTPCAKGDVVSVTIQNVVLPVVTIVAIHSDIATIQFESSTAKGEAGDKVAVDCSAYPCTISSPCYNAAENKCVKQVVHDRRNFGELEETSRCSGDALPCGTMKQDVPVAWAKKDGKSCKK